MRIAIAGHPLCGKTTLADEIAFEHGWPILHTDDLIDLGWSEASQAAADWIDEHKHDSFIIEGVAVPRALRKWLAQHLQVSWDTAPIDKYLFMTHPFAELTPGQQTMAKGCTTVHLEIEADLDALGVEVFDPPKGTITVEDLRL